MIKSLNSRLASLETVIAKKRDRPEPYLLFLENPWDIVVCPDAAAAWEALNRHRDRVTDVSDGVYAPMMRNIIHPAPDRRIEDFE